MLSIKHCRQSTFAETPSTTRHSRDARRRQTSMLVMYKYSILRHIHTHTLQYELTSVQPTTLNCITSQVTHHTTSSTAPVFQLARPHPVPMLPMYTWPATPLPSTPSPPHTLTFSLGSSVSGSSRISFPATLPPHSWSVFRTHKMAVEDRPDLWDEQLQTFWKA